ncbi:hypothetical protein [Coralloluteibacterium stylophorae]|uniref:Uncharacterized protein n=1 Tax=Coralloluteibacterium stylophorae TaxID=1776034 RepID=A0A8J7VR10_9GAMM|nr:hypothetical protein [Coralloluteibacterium stylophorae]MBS7457670.1 hypothetical protein [Coralloluteibacterium stylophorae]
MSEQAVRDRLFSRPATVAADGAMQVITALQWTEPAAQVIACATALDSYCAELGLDPREVLSVVGRMKADCRFRHLRTFDAVAAFVRNEVRPHL